MQIKTKGLYSRKSSLPGRPSLLSDSSSDHAAHHGICRKPASRLQTSLRLPHGNPGYWVLPSSCGYAGVKPQDESEQLWVRSIWSRDMWAMTRAPTLLEATPGQAPRPRTLLWVRLHPSSKKLKPWLPALTNMVAREGARWGHTGVGRAPSPTRLASLQEMTCMGKQNVHVVADTRQGTPRVARSPRSPH